MLSPHCGLLSPGKAPPRVPGVLSPRCGLLGLEIPWVPEGPRLLAKPGPWSLTPAGLPRVPAPPGPAEWPLGTGLVPCKPATRLGSCRPRLSACHPPSLNSPFLDPVRPAPDSRGHPGDTQPAQRFWGGGRWSGDWASAQGQGQTGNGQAGHGSCGPHWTLPGAEWRGMGKRDNDRRRAGGLRGLDWLDQIRQPAGSRGKGLLRGGPVGKGREHPFWVWAGVSLSVSSCRVTYLM